MFTIINIHALQFNVCYHVSHMSEVKERSDSPVSLPLSSEITSIIHHYVIYGVIYYHSQLHSGINRGDRRCSTAPGLFRVVPLHYH